MTRTFLLVALLIGAVAAGCGQSLGTRVRQLESEDPGVRRGAALAVGNHRGADKYPKVVELMCLVAKSDPERTVRAAGADALAELDGEPVVQTLADILRQDKSPFVRTHAAHALGQHEGTPAVIDPLAQALRTDPDVDVRIAAAESLRGFKEPAAAEALADGVADTDVAVSYKSWEHLRYMTGQDLPRETGPWKEFLASAEKPFKKYGWPPRMPRGRDQRPFIREGVGDSLKRAFGKDVYEQELE